MQERVELTATERKRLKVWIVISVTGLSSNMLAIGVIHALFSPSLLITLIFMALIWMGLLLFAIGYFFAGGHPQKMHTECERFLFLSPKEDFGIFHWKRSTIIFVDIFLVIIPTALGVWGLSHDIYLLVIGFPLFGYVPVFHIPISSLLVWSLIIQLIIDAGLLVGGIVGLWWEIYTWVDGRKGDTCFFYGLNTEYANENGDVYGLLDPRFIAGYLGAKPETIKKISKNIKDLTCKMNPKECQVE